MYTHLTVTDGHTGVQGVPNLDEVLSVNSLAILHLSDHWTPGPAQGPSWSEWPSAARREQRRHQTATQTKPEVQCLVSIRSWTMMVFGKKISSATFQSHSGKRVINWAFWEVIWELVQYALKKIKITFTNQTTLEYQSLACNLFNHKLLLGFHCPNWTQDCTQPS